MMCLLCTEKPIIKNLKTEYEMIPALVLLRSRALRMKRMTLVSSSVAFLSFPAYSKGTVLVGVGCCNQNTIQPVALNSKYLFLTALEDEKSKIKCQ